MFIGGLSWQTSPGNLKYNIPNNNNIIDNDIILYTLCITRYYSNIIITLSLMFIIYLYIIYIIYIAETNTIGRIV